VGLISAQTNVQWCLSIHLCHCLKNCVWTALNRKLGQGSSYRGGFQKLLLCWAFGHMIYEISVDPRHGSWEVKHSNLRLSNLLFMGHGVGYVIKRQSWIWAILAFIFELGMVTNRTFSKGKLFKLDSIHNQTEIRNNTVWSSCILTPLHSLTGPVGQPFASRLGGQRLASRWCTHTHNGTGFTC
jgi:hypothetical protein